MSIGQILFQYLQGWNFAWGGASSFLTDFSNVLELKSFPTNKDFKVAVDAGPRLVDGSALVEVEVDDAAVVVDVGPRVVEGTALVEGVVVDDVSPLIKEVMVVVGLRPCLYRYFRETASWHSGNMLMYLRKAALFARWLGCSLLCPPASLSLKAEAPMKAAYPRAFSSTHLKVCPLKFPNWRVWQPSRPILLLVSRPCVTAVCLADLIISSGEIEGVHCVFDFSSRSAAWVLFMLMVPSTFLLKTGSMSVRNT